MLYLLDSSVLIDANRKYYKLPQVPQFWTWLESKATESQVKLPDEMYREIVAGAKGDVLREWVMKRRDALLFREEVNISLVQKVTDLGYARDLDDEERARIGNDAFLIAYALADPTGRCVVTMEESKPSRQRANRHIPDVCKSLNISCVNTFEMLDRLDFRLT